MVTINMAVVVTGISLIKSLKGNPWVWMMILVQS